jgi:NO-binding membrane sensor protein with MHYT domain
MLILRHLFLFVHLIGFAMLLGGFLVQYLTGKFQSNLVMRIGLPVAFVAGLILAIPFPSGYQLNYTKLAVKLVIALIIGALMGIGTKQNRTDRPFFGVIGLLILLNAGIAVFW